MSKPMAYDHGSSLPSASIAKCSDEDVEMTSMTIIFDRYKPKLTTLPKSRGWVTKNMYMYKGFWHETRHRISVETVMALQDTFKAHPTDIYLATFPKSGTIWLKAIMFALQNRNRYKNDNLSTHPLLVSNPHICVPFIEAEIYKATPTYTNAHDSPRLFATHIPYTSLPQTILDSGCRIVYLCRNPKDVMVSLFHFANKLRDKRLDQLTFDEQFELFSKGVMPNGPYWDHVKEYHKVSLQQPENVLFLTYEDMTVDTANNVKRLAKFMGCPFTEEEEGEGVVQTIISLSSFENLREVNKHKKFRQHPSEVLFREGKVGDWINHLTDEMSRVLDDITEKEFDGLNISF